MVIHMKIKLYLDFDGVILDTINVTYRQLKELNITNEEQKQDYYQKLDWHKLIKETDQIDNSIDRIKEIINSSLYDVEILTHVNSEIEGEIKIDFIKDHLPNTKVITVPKSIEKCLTNNLLRDTLSRYERRSYPLLTQGFCSKG